MSNSENSSVNNEGIGVETVGETLHRERLTRNILIETLSIDLKLNEKFIIGIEESNYKNLPSIPYIRVYIKSIAEYLTLDAEELLNRFSQEQSLTIPDPDEERRDTISISVQNDTKQSPIIPIIFVIIAIIAAVLLLKKPVDEAPNSGLNDATDSLNFEVPVDTGLSSDSLSQEVTDILDTIETDSTELDSNDTTVSLIDSTSTEIAEVEKKNFLFAVSGVSDSAWMKVFVDGVPQFDGLIRIGDNLAFNAEDSVNILNGKNSAVAYSRNGESITIGETNRGIKYAKVTVDSIDIWRKSQWDRVFGTR